MDRDAIRVKIKESIAGVANIAVEEIGDAASYKDDLHLDSLTILEIVVDVEFKFQVDVPDEEMASIRTVEDTVNVVYQNLCEKVA
jgi:acyl carrier protein